MPLIKAHLRIEFHHLKWRAGIMGHCLENSPRPSLQALDPLLDEPLPEATTKGPSASANEYRAFRRLEWRDRVMARFCADIPDYDEPFQGNLDIPANQL